jgi:polysaccharide biosynthesis protein PslH
VNIGFISGAVPYLPSRGGYRLYGGNLIRMLSRRHRIDLVSLLRDDDGDHVDRVKPYCESLQTIPVNPPNLARKAVNFVASYYFGKPTHHRTRLNAILRDALKTRHWDVLHIEGGAVGGFVDTDLPVAKVLSLHDSWTLRCREMLNCTQSLHEKLYYTVLKYHEPRFERLLYPKFERCVVVADRDLNEVRSVVPKANLALIPYGTDTEYFHPVPVEKQPMSLVFHSHLGYEPNIEAALEFANEIFPLVRREIPNVVFHLVGAQPGPKIRALVERPGIALSADLPDLRSAVCSAQVYVCAIRYGTGLKSKILEAMAMRLPIVCYPGSTVGLEARDGEHFLVAQTPQEFAAQVVGLLKDPQRARRLAEAGRRLVEDRYSWESRAVAYEHLYRKVIDERRHRIGGVPIEFSSQHFNTVAQDPLHGYEGQP